MKYLTISLLVIATVCAVNANPTEEEHHGLLLRQRRDLSIFENTKKLIVKLVEDLQNSAQQAMNAITNFTSGIQDQLQLCREKLLKDLQSLKDRVTAAINNVITDSSSSIKGCIDSHRNEANLLFDGALTKTMSCADERVKDISELTEKQAHLANSALDFGNHVMAQMKNCTDNNNGNILATGSCLTAVAVQTEVKAAVYFSQTTLGAARIKLAFLTLPAALEVCAGTQLVEASVGTAKIVYNIGKCSASSILTHFYGSQTTSATETNTPSIEHLSPRK